MIKPGSIRFILAILVLFFHITKIVFIGYFAVLCFFMLSGYWITLMYENKYLKLKNPLKTFYLSRVWRLFPVFLLFNLLTFIVCYFYKPTTIHEITGLGFPHNITFWLSNFFLLGLNHSSPPVLGPAWSLDIELQFYLVYPLLFIFISKYNSRVLFVFSFITIILSLFFPFSFISKTLFYYVAFFVIGMLIYLNKIEFSRKAEILCSSLFVLILIVNYIFPELRKITMFNNESPYNRHLNEILPLLLIPLISNSVKNKSSKFDRVLGDMSFVIYLCHWMLIVPYNYYIKGLTVTQRIPYSLIYVVITLIVSYLFYKYYDKPIDSLRRKWVETNKMDTALESIALQDKS
jgi:peptidoglycan/LPS O-acetylase OafA/YrhL